MSEKRTDTANEPVEPQDDEFMDTGVLHERKPGCDNPDCILEHPHPEPS